MRDSLRSIRCTPSQLLSLQHIPTQHDMLPQHLVCKNELSGEYCNITLARDKKLPDDDLTRSKHVGAILSVLCESYVSAVVG